MKICTQNLTDSIHSHKFQKNKTQTEFPHGINTHTHADHSVRDLLTTAVKQLTGVYCLQQTVSYSTQTNSQRQPVCQYVHAAAVNLRCIQTARAAQARLLRRVLVRQRRRAQ